MFILTRKSMLKKDRIHLRSSDLLNSAASLDILVPITTCDIVSTYREETAVLNVKACLVLFFIHLYLELFPWNELKLVMF